MGPERLAVGPPDEVGVGGIDDVHAGADDVLGTRTQLGQGVVIEKSGVVGVNAGGGAQSPVRIIPAQGQGLAGL